MKKYLLILFTVGLFTGCSKYDDGELWNSVNDLEARLSALEKQCKEMNTNIESMKVIVDVLQSNDYITNVTVISENGVEIGYNNLPWERGKCGRNTVCRREWKLVGRF